MKRSVLAVVLMTMLVVPSSALAQVEAAITRGACGSDDVALMLRAFVPSTADDGVALSRTRVRSGLASLMERGLALTLLDEGSVVACGAIPASSEDPNRVEVPLEPTATGDPYGYAILRELTADRTTIVLAVPGLPVADQAPASPAQPELAENPKPQPTLPATPAGYDPTNPAQIGTALDVEGVRVTTTNLRIVDEYEFSTPKGGYVFVVVDVRIENAGQVDHFYSYMDFSGEDVRTEVGYDSVFFLSSDFLSSDSLDPGEFVTGTVVIEVQSTSQGIVLKYDPIALSEPDMYWEVRP